MPRNSQVIPWQEWSSLLGSLKALPLFYALEIQKSSSEDYRGFPNFWEKFACQLDEVVAMLLLNFLVAEKHLGLPIHDLPKELNKQKVQSPKAHE